MQIKRFVKEINLENLAKKFNAVSKYDVKNLGRRYK